MLHVEAVEFAYGDAPVLAGVDLEATDGELLVVVGHNGAGKSTLLALLAGLEEPDAGTISVGGAVGLAPEDPHDALFAPTVREELAFFPQNRGIDVDRHVEAALSAMDLEPFADRQPTSLSAGEQRRTAIAAVLAGDPAVVALDEPTGGLDDRAVTSMGELLSGLEATVVCATHHADFAYAHADAVAVLEAGQVVAQGSPRELLADRELLERAGVRPPGPVAWAAERGLDAPPADLDDAVALAREADLPRWSG